MKLGWIRFAVMGLLTLGSLGFAETGPELAFGSAYYGALDASMASVWFRGQRSKPPTGEQVPVVLQIEEDGYFEYQADGHTYPGYADYSNTPGQLALYFEDNRDFPPRSFVPVSISEDGKRLITPLFVLGPEEEMPRPPQPTAIFSGQLDSAAAPIWWKEVYWKRTGKLLPARLLLLDGDLFQYEVDGVVLATGKVIITELTRGRKSFRLVFDLPKDRFMNANFDPKNQTLAFNYGIRFTLNQQ